jgi:APA family basic amino acid/polyamine antiporter
MWFVIWNAIGLVIYFVWSSRNSRLARGEETAG